MYVGTNGFVFALDAVTGAVRHALRVSDAVGVGDYTTEVASDGARLYAGVHGYVYGIALDQWSKPAWYTGIGGTGAFKQVAVVCTGGRLFAASNGYAYELDPRTGKVIHELLLGSRFGSGDYTASLATDGRTLYAGMHGFVYAINLGNWKAARWNAGVGEGLTYRPPNVLFAHGKLFAGCNGSAYEISPANGSIVHRLRVTDAIGVGDYTTRVTSDGSSLYVGVHGYAYRIALSDWSRTVWHVSIGTASWPRVDVLGLHDRLFAGASGSVYEIAPSNGELRRSLLLASPIGVGNYETRLASDGHSLFVGAHGYVYRVVTLDGPFGFVTAAAAPNGDLHVTVLSVQDSVFHTLRKADGSWSKLVDLLGAARAPFSAARLVATAAFANGELNVLAIDKSGALWHGAGIVGGTWRPWSNLSQTIRPSLGALAYVSAATDTQNRLHVLVHGAKQTLWHTVRQANGTWQPSWGNVTDAVTRGPKLGPLAISAAATNRNGDLHIAVLDQTRRLWLTRRASDGSWPEPWRDLDAAIAPPVGALRFVAIATNARDELHVAALDRRGAVWHAMGGADGRWPSWGDVNGVLVRNGHPSLDGAVLTAIACTPAGDLHVLAIDEPAGLYHTIRRADGGWPQGWGNVAQAFPP